MALTEEGNLDVATIAPLLFIVGASAQYVGAAWAVDLFDNVAPESVAWLRVCGAALVLAVVVRPWRHHWTPAAWRSAAAFGVATACMNITFYLAVDRLPLGTTVAVEFIGPITVAALSSRSLRAWIALGVTAAGVVLVSGAQWSNHAAGVLFALLAAACWGSYIVLGKRVSARTTGIEGLALALACGAVLTAPIGAWRSGPAWHSPNWLGLCVVIGVMSTIVPYGLDQVVMRHVPLRTFALMLALLPTTAAVIGALMLRQQLSVGEWFGIALVVIALVVNGTVANGSETRAPSKV